MASKTYAEMQAYILVVLQDSTTSGQASSNDIFKAAELDLIMPTCLIEVSGIVPHETKESVLTTASSNKLTLSAENKRKLILIEELEYKVDQNPEQFRNFKRWGDVLTMEYGGLPSADETVYLYLNKVHVLQKEIGTTDTAGAIKTEAAVGSTSLALKSLGTGTINEDTKLTIAGDDTEYTVTATVTIAANEATVVITPALVAQASADAVVTLALADSTLDLALENAYADYVAGKAAINKSRSYINSVVLGTSFTPAELEEWGQNKLVLALSALRAMAPKRRSYLYPTT